jgi:membrane protein implicated in regulation of membrane protease activity
MRASISIALVFGLAAAASRTAMPLIHTRYQLAVFLVLAALFETAGRRRLTGSPPKITGFLLNAMAIVLAFTVIKLMIDGSFHRPAWVRRVIATIDR